MTVHARAEDVALDLVTRLSGLTIADGAETDIGVTVFQGRRKIPEDTEVPCLMLIEGNDVPGQQTGPTGIKITQAYVVWAFDKCDAANPNTKAHAMIRDIKRAIFRGGNTTLDGKVRQVNYEGRDIGPRPDGAGFVQVEVAITVEYAENLAAP